MKTDRTTFTLDLLKLRDAFLLGSEIDMAEVFAMAPGSDIFAVAWASTYYASETVKIVSRTDKTAASRSGEFTSASVQLIRDTSRIDYNQIEEDKERAISQDCITVDQISAHDYHIFVDARCYPEVELVPVAVDRLKQFLAREDISEALISPASFDRLRAFLDS